MNHQNGYDSNTKIYHSLNPSHELLPETLPLSAATFILPLLQSKTTVAATTTVFIDSGTGHSLSSSEFVCRVHSLASSLHAQKPNLKSLVKGHVALIFSPPSLHTPVLYFSLLSLGVAVFPVSPYTEDSELEELIRQAKPAIAFTTGSLSNKLASLPYCFSHGTILLDSSEFDSMLTFKSQHGVELEATVYQSDTAAMLCSSATSGPAKIVQLTHRNIIAALPAHAAINTDSQRSRVWLLTTKPELMTGFGLILKSVATAHTMVFLERCKDLETIVKTIETYKVDSLFGYSMIVGAMAAQENAEVVNKYNVTSLKLLFCGGMHVYERRFKLFKEKFPHAEIMQAYGLTEIAGGVTIQLGSPIGRPYGSVGRLLSHMQAQIVDPSTAQALPPGSQGELLLRGPSVMKGYVDDEKLTATRLDSKEGWLKTGDVCYFDSDGYLYIVDRLKEFITVDSYKVSPSELEKVLLLHPDIEEAIVVPYSGGGGGEVPMALVIKKLGSTINESEVISFVATKVEQYKKIQHVRFITSMPNFGKENSLPISHQGKFQRKLMLDHYAVSDWYTPK